MKAEVNLIKGCWEKIEVNGKVSLNFNFANKTPLYLPQPSQIQFNS